MGLLERNQSERKDILQCVRFLKSHLILARCKFYSILLLLASLVGCQPFGNFGMALVPAPAAEAPQVPLVQLAAEAPADKEATWKSVRGGAWGPAKEII